MEQAQFRFDPNLIETLGRQYRTCEDAIKELVANTWDADATTVEITLPDPLTTNPIVIQDDGYGISPFQIQKYLLTVGYDRRQDRGETTPKGRKVRGFRGIGKFAGLQIAETMTIITTNNGRQSTVVLNGSEFRSLSATLESIPLSMDVIETDAPSGTRIELSGIRQSLRFPSQTMLARVLLREFSVRDGFDIRIDGQELSPGLLTGQRHEISLNLSDGHVVSGSVWLTERPREVADTGVVIRVDGRAIGEPTYFGLDADPEIPRSMLQRITGNLNADHLRNDVLSNWGGFVENSKGYRDLVEHGRAELRDLVERELTRETAGEPAAFVRSFDLEIQRIPIPRRDLARRALSNLFRRFYDFPERRQAIAEFVLKAFEQDEYWLLAKRIDQMSPQNAKDLASVLVAWGLYEIGEIAHRASQRKSIVERFETLVWDDETLELQDIHRVLEHNVWLLGDEHELATSNKTLKNIIEQVLGHRYQGHRERERPDLLFAGTKDRFVLVELKRPKHRIDRSDVAQVLTYRDEIQNHYPSAHIDTIVVGRQYDPALARDVQLGCDVMSFAELLNHARQRLDWLVSNLEDTSESNRLPD